MSFGPKRFDILKTFWHMLWSVTVAQTVVHKERPNTPPLIKKSAPTNVREEECSRFP